MKRFLSITLAIALLLGLGSLAVLARPGSSSEPAASAAIQVESSQQTASQPAAPVPAAPAAPNAGPKWNSISIPLNVKIDGPDAGVDNNADEVASHIQSFCPSTSPCPNAIPKVARWRADLQQWEVREVGTLFGGEDFVVNLADALLVEADSSASGLNGTGDDSFAWVGDVPAAGAIQYSITANNWTYILIPLDRTIGGAPANADALAGSIGPGVTKVARWLADLQQWEVREVGTLFGGENFAVTVGYPYQVYTTTAYDWP